MSESVRTASVRRAVPWVIGLSCLVAAWFVSLLTVPDTAAWAPFIVEAGTGEPAVGRNISVVVHDATRADAVVAPGWRAEGSWVVVDISAEAVTDERGALLANAQLSIDGVAFRATERTPSMLDTSLWIGDPVTGSLAFEIPDDVDGPAVLQLSLRTDTRADSLVEYRLDLDDLPLDDEREIQAPAEGEMP